MSQFRSILWVELLGGIGDSLIALPAIEALARSHPQAHITVLTFAPGSELLHHHPWIHHVVVTERGKARQAVEELLAEVAFDLVVSDTTYDGIAQVISQSRAQQTVTNLWRSPPAHELVGDRFIKILWTEGLLTQAAITDTQGQIHLTAAEKIAARQALKAAYRPLVVLYPEAGMAIKQWPAANFIHLGRALQARYGATILVPVGGDAAIAEQIVQAIGGTAQIWPRGTLRQLAAAIAQADLMIAADTGPARIAAALAIPTVTLFGPSWHGRYGQPAPHINLQGFPDCPERLIHNFTEQNCWYSGVCPLEQWNSCLEEISVAQVLAAAEGMLGQPGQVASPSQAQQQDSPTIAEAEGAIAPPDWHSVRNLLVMRLDNIGDVIMTTPALRSLRQNLPQAQITLMASPGGALTEPLLPWVDEVLPWRTLWQDLGRLDFDPAREWDLIETLKQRQFDAAIILTSFSQSPHPPGLICALAGIPLRLGESKESDLGTLTHAVPPAPDEIHQVDRNLRLLEAVGFQVPDRHLSLAVPEAAQARIAQLLQAQGVANYLVLNPWTSCQSRNYDPIRFALAARQLSQITGWAVMVTGVEKDRDRSHPLLEILGEGAIDLMGKTQLAELVALVAGAKLILTNNTSTMHIADAMQTPNVILFAGTELEGQWRPRYSPSRVLRRATVCSPCYGFACPYTLECLDIEPEAVVEAALEVLGWGEASGGNGIAKNLTV